MMVNIDILYAYKKLNNIAPLETNQTNILQLTTTSYYRLLKFEDHIAPILTTYIRPSYRDPGKP